MLSTEATVIASEATPGAPLEKVPEVPELPAEITTVVPEATRESASCAVG